MRHHHALEAMIAPIAAAPGHSAVHLVQEELEIITIRVNAMAMGRAHGFVAEAVKRLEIVVCEMAENIARYAGSGQIILRPVGSVGSGCIEVLAIDRGPGIADMPRVMRESSSPSGDARRDSGITSIRRLSSLFDIYSQPGVGTAVLAHVAAGSGKGWAPGCSQLPEHSGVGAVCVPLAGEEECGDAWIVAASDGRRVAMLVDGLGHGGGAAVAAQAAWSAFAGITGAAAGVPERIVQAMHTVLLKTRGAALSVVVLDRGRQTANFHGVGNVEGRVVTADSTRFLIPHAGIVGHAMPRAAVNGEVAWPAEARLVMHSDGISSRWRADSYPGLLARHPALLAGVLFRDFAREQDDATVLVLRESATAVE